MNEGIFGRIHPVTAHRAEGGSAGLELSPASGPGATNVFEDEYQKIGRWTGPEAAPEAREKRWEFWRLSGVGGVRWLVRRLREERHIDVLHGAASLLAGLGEVVLEPVFEELARANSRDQSLCLLWSLVSLSEAVPTLRMDARASEAILADRLQDDDPDLREAAAEAMRLVESEQAARWLELRLKDEADDDVRRTMERELTRHRAGRS